MHPNAPEAPALEATVVLRLLVRNHPGVMSHVCGLFARRSFNLDGILCFPIGDASRSAMLLWVRDDARLEQLVRQLGKLEDVLSVEREPQGYVSALRDRVRRGEVFGLLGDDTAAP